MSEGREGYHWSCPCCGRLRVSARELEILRHAMAGVPSKDIAKLVGSTYGTVKNQLTTIYAKLGAEDRTSAVAQALRRGYLTLDGDIHPHPPQQPQRAVGAR